MIKVTRYNPAKTYFLNNGELGTPERMLADFPSIRLSTHIICTDEGKDMLMSCDPLSRTRIQMGIDPALSEDDAIAAIEAVYNAPPPEPEPSVEERIAAALEFQNVATMAAMMTEEV